MKNREVISMVRSTNKLFGDASLNDRSILAELRSNALFLINQKTNERKLWATSTIYTTIDCLQMEQVNMGDCCGVAMDRIVSRSKHKLPQLMESNFKYTIQGVYDVNSTMRLKYADLNRFINIQKLKLNTNDTYYWITDNRLYISSPNIKQAKIIAAFDGDVPYEILFPDCDCNHGKKRPCTSRLDEDFKCPGNLISPVVKMTTATLLQNYFRLPKDHTADNKDDQANKI